MKVRKQFVPLGKASETPVYDAVSMTQPDMSMSIKQIVEQFAFVGDTPLGMMQFEEPSLKDDERLFGGVELDNLNIAELEELSVNLMDRANYLRSLPPEKPSADAPPEKPSADAPPDEK